MATLHEGDTVAFKVNPLGSGVVYGLAEVVKPGDRVCSLIVHCVQKTPYIREGQGLILANTMLLPLDSLQLNDSSPIM